MVAPSGTDSVSSLPPGTTLPRTWRVPDAEVNEVPLNVISAAAPLVASAAKGDCVHVISCPTAALQLNPVPLAEVGAMSAGNCAVTVKAEVDADEPTLVTTAPNATGEPGTIAPLVFNDIASDRSIVAGATMADSATMPEPPPPPTDAEREFFGFVVGRPERPPATAAVTPLTEALIPDRLAAPTDSIQIPPPPPPAPALPAWYKPSVAELPPAPPDAERLVLEKLADRTRICPPPPPPPDDRA